jgi:hypothetical protein
MATNFVPFQQSSLFSNIASGGGQPLGAVPMDFAKATPYKWNTDPITPDPEVPESGFDMEVFCSMPANAGHPMCVNRGAGKTGDDNEPEQRPYMSIEDMKNASDYELLNYLTDGVLANDLLGFLPSKLGEEFYLKKSLPNMLTVGLGLLGVTNPETRRKFMEKELAKRGYDLNTKQGQLGLTQAMGIINNAQSSKLGLTPEQINNQIQAKKEAQNIVNQGGNPYAQTMTYQQIKDDAQATGGTVNPHELNFTASPQNYTSAQSKAGAGSYNIGNPHMMYNKKKKKYEKQYAGDY